MEIGIVDTKKSINISKAISSLLTRSVEYAKDIKGGYVPEKYITNAQLNYVSPYAISNLWGLKGYRFIVTKSIKENKRQLIGTILISHSRNNLFFFSNRYNNIRTENLPHIFNNNPEWFSNFSFPNIYNYKPSDYNQIANFAIEKSFRGNQMGRKIIDVIIENYSSHYIQNNDKQIIHSQPLICGKGLFQISDPAWLKRRLNMNFKLRAGAETFYLGNENNTLIKTKVDGQEVCNVDYNRLMGLDLYYGNEYEKYVNIDDKNMNLVDEIDRVRKLSLSENAKLQYYQTYFNFDDFMC